MVDLQIWCVVENNTVCLAGSIPALRPLLRDSSAGRFPAYSYGTSDRHSKPHMGSSGRQTHHNIPKRQHDGHSEEYILSSVGVDSIDQITKTTAISVAYEPRNTQENDAAYELRAGKSTPAFG